VSEAKRALVITDGTQSIQPTAQLISDALAGFDVKICPAESFAGNDLLPASLFFIGCENPKPENFAYLEELFQHINLASRKCGIFCKNEKTLDYLRGIVKDSEAHCFELLLSPEGKTEKTTIEKWLNNIL
jgi:hypothetical protein